MGMSDAKCATERRPLRVMREKVRDGAIWHADGDGDFDPRQFNPEYWLQRGPVSITERGRGNSMVVAGKGEQWVVRHYRRGGLPGPIMGDLYLWTGEARTRPAREWRLLCDLWQLGLAVPRPVAARYVRHGPFYRADMITALIEGSRAWSGILLDGRGKDAQFAAVGSAIRSLHDSGVYHADLNAHNILLDADNRVYFVDFDRARRRSAGAWRDKNLIRLERSLNKIAQGRNFVYRVSQWRALVTAYHAKG